MKFLLIDIETTGLDENIHQVLEVGVMVGDYTTPVPDLPRKRWRFAYNPVIGDPFALNMNQQLIKDMISKPKVVNGYETNYVEWKQFPLELESWARYYMNMSSVNKVTFAGKNIGTFDLRFLRKNMGWALIHHHHRVIDPAMLFFNPSRDKVLPDTKTCIERAGILWDNSKLHDALDDCHLVLELLRERYRKGIGVG